jgi:hypothetical protein
LISFFLSFVDKGTEKALAQKPTTTKKTKNALPTPDQSFPKQTPK